MGINSGTKDVDGEKYTSSVIGQRVGQKCCESDPVAEVEWSPELCGPNRARVAHAGAATVIKAEGIIIGSAVFVLKISYS